MPDEPNNPYSERLSISAAGATITMSGFHVIIILLLIGTICGILYLNHEHLRLFRESFVEHASQNRREFVTNAEENRRQFSINAKLARDQFWLFYRELKLQTVIMTYPPGERAKLMPREDVERQIQEHGEYENRMMREYQGKPGGNDSGMDQQIDD